MPNAVNVVSKDSKGLPIMYHLAMLLLPHTMVPGAGLQSLLLAAEGLLARSRWPTNEEEEGNGGGGGMRGVVTLEGAGLPCLPVTKF